MEDLSEKHLDGLQYLEAATTLLQRVRSLHPTAGEFEAADRQWWWRIPRSTDTCGQLFWFDREGRPEAAVIATDWGDGIGLDPILLPDAKQDWVAHVVERGLAHASELGFNAVDFVVDRDNDRLREVLADLGFTVAEDQTVQAWLAADDRPAVSALLDGYRLVSRRERSSGSHPMIERSGSELEKRLRQTSLYRADLDLAIVDCSDNVAGYALFWFDPVTSTGLVEPMRTEDAHQGRGLGRHLLTVGINKLAAVGAGRVKISFNPDNAAARSLYLSAGFDPVKRSMIASPQRNIG